MIYPVYCVRDVKVGFQPQMLVEQNDASAIRGFSYAVNNEGLMNYSPSDFDLYRIGRFDTDKGIFEAVTVPELVASGASVFGDKKE